MNALPKTGMRRLATTLRRLLAGEEGLSLLFALLAISVGTLLVGPLLAQVSSSYRVTTATEETLHESYSSDAAAEYGLWKLTNDPELQQTLLANLGSAQTLTVPADVNGMAATVQIVALEGEAAGGESGGGANVTWVIWANSQTRNSTVQITGSGHRVYGGIHSNFKIKISGSGNWIYGPVEYVSSYSESGSGNGFTPGPPDNPVQAEVGTFPIAWNIADYRPGGARALAAGEDYYTHAKWTVSGSGVTVPPGLHYCTGKVSFSGSGLTGTNVTVVSEDTIDVSGSGISFTPYEPGLTFFSPKSATSNVISISGSGNNNTGGSVYAPNGRVSLTGSGGTIAGVFVGDTVDVSGSGATFLLADVEIPVTGGGETGCGVYDLLAAGGGANTYVRVQVCDGELDILSWYVD